MGIQAYVLFLNILNTIAPPRPLLLVLWEGEFLNVHTLFQYCL